MRFSFIFVLISLWIFATPATSGVDQVRLADREKFKRAQLALAQGKYSEFRQLQSEIASYPLHPYLEFGYLSKTLSRAPSHQVAHFLQQQRDTPLAPRLRHRWLRSLAKKGQWENFLKDYEQNPVRSAELQCYAVWAEHKLGQTQSALTKVKPLWLVARSQPDACDPVFKLWRGQGFLTDELAWRRFSLAIRHGRGQLARYLVRYMSKEQQRYANAYREVRRRPERVTSFGFFKNPDLRAEEVVVYGVKRLARKNPIKAEDIWNKYGNQHDFGTNNNYQIRRAIAIGFAKQDLPERYVRAVKQYGLEDDSATLEAGIEMSVRTERWLQTISLIEKLPTEAQATERWRYWYARALYTIAVHENNQDFLHRSREIVADLARQRSFYGFMSADHMQQEYQLNHTAFTIDGNFLEQFRLTPATERASELVALNQITDARREWQFITRGLDNDHHYAAAHHAYEIGWYSQAIRSAINAERWDDLKLRFPPAYHSPIMRAASQNGLRENWLFAVARQESAMAADARSPKGAVGLMQLLPSTAKAVARKTGAKPPRLSDLLQPDVNINLGAAYLKQLSEQFDGNIIYATAAYNAGPHRVKGWLDSSGHLPMDVWIENIPFAETRQYVKNVLAYSVIYAYKSEQRAFKMATAQYSSPLGIPPAIQNAEQSCESLLTC